MDYIPLATLANII